MNSSHQKTSHDPKIQHLALTKGNPWGWHFCATRFLEVPVRANIGRKWSSCLAVLKQKPLTTAKWKIFIIILIVKHIHQCHICHMSFKQDTENDFDLLFLWVRGGTCWLSKFRMKPKDWPMHTASTNRSQYMTPTQTMHTKKGGNPSNYHTFAMLVDSFQNLSHLSFNIFNDPWETKLVCHS